MSLVNTYQLNTHSYKSDHNKSYFNRRDKPHSKSVHNDS